MGHQPSLALRATALEVSTCSLANFASCETQGAKERSPFIYLLETILRMWSSSGTHWSLWWLDELTTGRFVLDHTKSGTDCHSAVHGWVTALLLPMSKNKSSWDGGRVSKPLTGKHCIIFSPHTHTHTHTYSGTQTHSYNTRVQFLDFYSQVTVVLK